MRGQTRGTRQEGGEVGNAGKRELERAGGNWK